jgi:hypothetical protein
MAMEKLNIRAVAGDSPADTDRLVVRVPRFPRGDSPPPDRAWAPLLAGEYFKWGYPVYWEESDILALVRDEAEYRLNCDPWMERCWFLVGRIVRDRSGLLWGKIHKCLPALGVRSSASSFEFGPDTWATLQAEKGPEEVTLGWIHSHSIDFLRKMENDLSQQNHYREDQAGPSGMGRATGLFLSAQDIESALKRGFNGPYQLTCVLDSDVCSPDRSGTALGQVLGVWGWFGAKLCRRSIHIIKDGESRA